MKRKLLNKKAFTLIELLVVISIIAVLIGLSAFSLQASKKSGRDAKRKSDLELIKSGFEIYRSDCGEYPETLSTTLIGSGETTDCPATNIYILQVPVDPATNVPYGYLRGIGGNTYELCAALEKGGTNDVCSAGVSCGSTSCNYLITNP